jgi:galacturan 1,4-alpha-galacturonidase
MLTGCAVIASGTHGLAVSCSSGVGGNYLFENAVVSDSLMAARFKGVLGTTCNVTNVTWRNIEVRNVSYPVHFIETYGKLCNPRLWFRNVGEA